MSRKRNPQAQPASTPKDAALDALAADPGPLLFSMGINRATARLTFSGNTASEHDLELLREALTIAQANVQQELVKAAEARGAAKAAEKAP